MKKTKIIDKIQKLLRLSESANVNEAAAAAARAQALMEQHRIDRAILTLGGDGDDQDTIRAHKDAPVFSGGKIVQWKLNLADTLCRHNGCTMYINIGQDDAGRPLSKVVLVGRSTEVGTIRYMFDYLAAEVNRLCRKLGKGKGRVWANNFRLGAVATINQRMSEARRQFRRKQRERARAQDTEALVRLDDALAHIDKAMQRAEEWMKSHVNPSGTRKNSGHQEDWDAWMRGREAARDINLESSSKSLPNTKTSIGGKK